MPTYQYLCTECGQDLEAVQSFNDAALTECPACSGRLRKKFGSVGVVFKGSGFYRNDSRPGNGSGAAAASSTEKGDAKPASTEKSAGDKPASKESSSSGSSNGSSSSSGSASTTSSSTTAA